MRDAFSWTICIETEEVFLRTKPKTNYIPVSDGAIRDAIRETFANNDYIRNIWPSEIIEMLFIAVDNNGTVFQETLSPHCFWPVHEADFESKMRAKFRRCEAKWRVRQ